MIPVPDFLRWLEYAPYGVEAERKHDLMLEAMLQLTQWHAQNCTSYHHVLQTLQVKPGHFRRIQDVPYMPVRLFKEFELLSIPRDEVFKTMTSSGTSGQQISSYRTCRKTISA